jgi:hypothetical protein
MTDRDEIRASKALQGLEFPASKAEMIAYAQQRQATEKTLRALKALPGGRYESRNHAAGSVPQRPEQQ